MNKNLYIMLMENVRELNSEIIQNHVDHLKALDNSGKLYLCGPFTDYKGGMVIFNVSTYNEAKELAEKDPFIAKGYKTYGLRTVEVANNENNYLL
ncbi:MAG: hypothetical protein K0S61_3299 [Anaerocolumna sp.]|jgi:uncharacterized protein YciI|nr:hypothetical protein [Anaerocolumna sp.]